MVPVDRAVDRVEGSTVAVEISGVDAAGLVDFVDLIVFVVFIGFVDFVGFVVIVEDEPMLLLLMVLVGRFEGVTVTVDGEVIADEPLMAVVVVLSQ